MRGESLQRNPRREVTGATCCVGRVAWGVLRGACCVGRVAWGVNIQPPRNV
jgi:hypothetical protein